MKLTSLILSSLLLIPTACFATDNTLTKDEKAEGWQLLFNGQDMSQWRNFKKPDLSDKWVVENGEMKLTGKGGGDILTKASYKNYDLKIDWKISSAGNSGSFIMADEAGKQIWSHAVEVQILDNEKHSDNKIASHLSGSIFDMIASPVKAHKKAGEWNQVRILLNNKVLKVWQNGVLTTDVLIGGKSWQQSLAASKFNGWTGFAMATVGHVGLQDHRDPVFFKNIKIKEL